MQYGKLIYYSEKKVNKVCVRSFRIKNGSIHAEPEDEIWQNKKSTHRRKHYRSTALWDKDN